MNRVILLVYFFGLAKLSFNSTCKNTPRTNYSESLQWLVEAIAQLRRMAFHGFNHIIGRLTQSTHSQPLYPLSPAPLEKVDPPKTMFYDPTNNMRRGPAPAATAQSGTASYSTVSPKIAKRFQIFNSDLPVFLLGGKKDKILFGLTFVLVGVSTLQSVFYIGGNVFK